MELIKKEGIYVVRFKGVDGKTHQRSTKMSNVDDAKAVVEQAKLKEIEQAALANPHRLTAMNTTREIVAVICLAIPTLVATSFLGSVLFHEYKHRRDGEKKGGEKP